METLSRNHIKMPVEPVEQLNSFKEVVLKIRSFGQEIYRFKYWVILSILIFSINSLYQNKGLKTTYPAELTFMLNENNNNLENSSGFLLSLGRRATELNFARIEKLATTKNLINKVIFRKTLLKGRKDFIANHIIDMYQFHKLSKPKTNTNESTKLSLYFTQDDFSKFTPEEHITFKSIQDLLNGIVKTSLDSKTNFLELRVNSLNESLSILLMKIFYEELRKFYIQDATAIPRINLQQLQTRADAIYPKLKIKEQLMNTYLHDKSFLNRTDYIQKTDVARDKELLSVAYVEILKNQEKIRYQLQTNTPFFQIIDQDYSPITPIIPSKMKLKSVLLEGLLGGFLVILLIIIRKSYLDAMA